jgi:hypothetical protein
MAIKHKAELGLDPASAEIIVLRRLIYTISDYAKTNARGGNDPRWCL